MSYRAPNLFETGALIGHTKCTVQSNATNKASAYGFARCACLADRMLSFADGSVVQQRVVTLGNLPCPPSSKPNRLASGLSEC